MNIEQQLATALRNMSDRTHICGEICKANALCPTGVAAREALAAYDKQGQATRAANIEQMQMQNAFEQYMSQRTCCGAQLHTLHTAAQYAAAQVTFAAGFKQGAAS